MTTSEFVKQFRQADPRKLALQASRYPDVDMPYALNQIQGWQTALRKLPSWAACDGVVYPPHLNMEQCSSEATARYKQQVARRWAERIPNASRTSMTDLTGGFGVDFSFTSRCFDCATYVERNASLCEVVGANLPRLGIRNAHVKCAEAEAVLKQTELQTMIFLDPARRDEHGAKTVLIADCTPDVCQLLPSLMQKSQFVMLKLSPMLDWHKAIVDLDGKVREVHIVSADGECKELLLVLAPDGKPEVQVFCVDILSKPDSQGVYPRSEFVYSIATNVQEEVMENNSKSENSTSAQPTNSTFNIHNSTFSFVYFLEFIHIAYFLHLLFGHKFGRVGVVYLFSTVTLTVAHLNGYIVVDAHTVASLDLSAAHHQSVHPVLLALYKHRVSQLESHSLKFSHSLAQR